MHANPAKPHRSNDKGPGSTIIRVPRALAETTKGAKTRTDRDFTAQPFGRCGLLPREHAESTEDTHG
jgi:hypothetical protein